MESSFENKCGVEGCISLHDDPPIYECKCRGKYLCIMHRNLYARTHKFPHVLKENEPWFCNMPRLVSCQYPYCDCGRQGGPFG